MALGSNYTTATPLVVAGGGGGASTDGTGVGGQVCVTRSCNRYLYSRVATFVNVDNLGFNRELNLSGTGNCCVRDVCEIWSGAAST